MDWNYIPELISIAVLGILLAFHHKTLFVRTERDWLFMRCIVAAMISTAINVVSVITIVAAGMLPRWLPYLCSDVFFVAVVAMVVSFGRYWLVIVYEDAKDRAYYTLCTAFGYTICAIMVLAVAANRFTPILYSFNEKMEYVREEWNRLPLYLSLAYVGCGVIGLSTRWDELEKPTRNALVTAPVALAPFIVIGNIIPNVQLQGTAFMVSLLVLYLSFHSNASAYDQLTGSFNLDSFYLTLRRQYPTLPPRALVMFAWQNYDVVRNEYGHQMADQLTKAIAAYLKQVYGQRNVFRIAEDQFVCAMMEHVGYRSMEEAYAHLNADWLIGSVLCRVDCCAAYYEALPDQICGQDVISYLKYAIARAQHEGNIAIVPCSEELLYDYECEREIATVLKEAIKSGDFLLNLNPILKREGETWKFFGADCCIGFRFETCTTYTEEQIMRVAEQYNLLNPINELLLRRACAFQRQLNIIGMGDIVLFCDVTQTQLLSESVIARILGIIEEEHADLRGVKLQLSGQTLNLGPRVRECLLQLHKRGVGVCLKDTARCNIDDLLTAPFSYIKVNEAALFGMGLSGRLNAFFRTVLSFFSQFNTTVIAGNIVSEEHIPYLEAHGFQYMQGMGVMQPMQQEEFVRRLKRERGLI